MRVSILRFVLVLGLASVVAPGALLRAQGAEAEVRRAVDRYNSAFVKKDFAGLRAMLVDDFVLFEHSIYAPNADEAWEKYMKPELSAFQDTKAEFSDVRVWASGDVALVTRRYQITGTMNEKPLDARGHETMGWVRRDGSWKLTHINYSHPCRACPAP